MPDRTRVSELFDATHKVGMLGADFPDVMSVRVILKSTLG